MRGSAGTRAAGACCPLNGARRAPLAAPGGTDRTKCRAAACGRWPAPAAQACGSAGTAVPRIRGVPTGTKRSAVEGGGGWLASLPPGGQAPGAARCAQRRPPGRREGLRDRGPKGARQAARCRLDAQHQSPAGEAGEPRKPGAPRRPVSDERRSRPEKFSRAREPRNTYRQQTSAARAPAIYHRRSALIVKGCGIPAQRASPAWIGHDLRAGVAQASREETAECTAAAVCRNRLWGFDECGVGSGGYAAAARKPGGAAHDPAA